MIQIFYGMLQTAVMSETHKPAPAAESKLCLFVWFKRSVAGRPCWSDSVTHSDKKALARGHTYVTMAITMSDCAWLTAAAAGM